MNTRTPLRTPRRTAAFAAAMIAMLLQLVMVAEHLGAEAGRLAFRDSPARMGFLQICTGEGVVNMPVPGATSAGAGSEPHTGCVICGNACVAGFDLPAAAVPPVFTAFEAPPVTLPVPIIANPWHRLRTAHAIRAPPVLSV